MASDRPNGGPNAEALRIAIKQTRTESAAVISNLCAKVKQHKAWKERHLDTVLMAQNCGKQEGMEAAAAKCDKKAHQAAEVAGPDSSECAIAVELADEIRVAAKQLIGEAGSREGTTPASPSPGSVSPVKFAEAVKKLEIVSRSLAKLNYTFTWLHLLDEALAALRGEKIAAESSGSASPVDHTWLVDGTCQNCGVMEDRANEQCFTNSRRQ